MEITKEELVKQIGLWVNERQQKLIEKDLKLAEAAELGGAIQAYQILLSQIETGADAELPAPASDEEGNEDGNE